MKPASSGSLSKSTLAPAGTPTLRTRYLKPTPGSAARIGKRKRISVFEIPGFFDVAKDEERKLMVGIERQIDHHEKVLSRLFKQRKALRDRLRQRKVNHGNQANRTRSKGFT